MSTESWLKVGLPAFPLGFTVFGAWLYWGENPLALLPPGIAFWGLGVLYYLFTHLYIPNRQIPLILTIGAAILWLVASITSHNLAKFLTSPEYSGVVSLLLNRDFGFAYVCASLGCIIGLVNFYRYEPLIVAQSQADREQINQEE